VSLVSGSSPLNFPRYRPVTIATGLVSGAMIPLLIGFVFLPEFLELLNNLVILSDLLVDREKDGIDREHSAEQDA
jgi:hypothetical protein